MAEALTKRQKEVLDYMVEYMQKEHRPPSVRDIQFHFGFKNPSGVVCHLVALEKKGFIVNSDPRSARSWRPTKRTIDCKCPECGCLMEVTEELV